MHHYHRSVSMSFIFCIFQIFSEEKHKQKEADRVVECCHLTLCHLIRWIMSVCAHTFASKRDVFLCVKEIVGERKIRNKSWKKISENGIEDSLVNMASWKKETRLTRGKQRSNICLLSAMCKPRQTYTVHMANIGFVPKTVWRRS